jgi:hypothetical protein
MKALRHIVSLAAITAIVAAYKYIADIIWGYLGAYGPMLSLMRPLRRQSPILVESLITVHDTVVNIVIAYPFALLILRTPAYFRWRFVAVAVAASFIYDYRLVILDSSEWHLFLTTRVDYYGIIADILVLPFCIWLASRHWPSMTSNPRMDRDGEG